MVKNIYSEEYAHTKRVRSTTKNFKNEGGEDMGIKRKLDSHTLAECSQSKRPSSNRRCPKGKFEERNVKFRFSLLRCLLKFEEPNIKAHRESSACQI